MHKHTLTVLLALVFMSISFPTSYAVTGKVQIITTNAPTKVIADLNFQLNVSLRITCTSTTDNILARIDISPHGSHQIVASNSLGLGSIPDPWAKKTWNVTMTSNLHSPASLGAWMLEVRAWVFAGVYPIALDNQTIMIQVVTRSSQVQVITASASNSTTSTSVSSSSALDRQTNSDTFIVAIPQTSLKMIAPLFAVGAVAASVTIVVRKRKTRSEQENPSEKIITLSTGYPEVDPVVWTTKRRN